MSRLDLGAGELDVLERLNNASLELGELPPDSVEKLEDLGLVRTVLGNCEITRAGQLTWCRYGYLKQSGLRKPPLKRNLFKRLRDTGAKSHNRRFGLKDFVSRGQ